MYIKTNLHFHAKEDPEDRIDYTFLEGLARAKELGFDALALTCHNKLFDTPSFRAAAEKQHVLFIPGIELTIEKAHTVILNPDPSIESVSTFRDLAAYRHVHPDIFILAPHPYFPGGFSLQEKLEEYIGLFDAIEHSWFYSRFYNRNAEAARIAKRYHKPFIATSDTHDIRFLARDYAVIDAEKKTIPSLFDALHKGKFENYTSPKSFLRDMAGYLIGREFAGGAKKPHFHS